MASITTAQASMLSVAAVPGRYYLDQRPTDQFFDALPFIPIEGHDLVLNVIDAAEGGAGPGLSEFADAEAAGAAIDQNMPTIATRTFALKRISAEMPVDSVIPSKFGSHRDILAGLKQQDRARGALRQAARQHAAGRPGADDDVVEFFAGHSRSRQLSIIQRRYAKLTFSRWRPRAARACVEAAGNGRDFHSCWRGGSTLTLPGGSTRGSSWPPAPVVAGSGTKGACSSGGNAGRRVMR